MAGMITGNLIRGKGLSLMILPADKPKADYYELAINEKYSGNKLDMSGTVTLTTKGKNAELSNDSTIKIEYWEKGDTKKTKTKGTVLKSFPAKFTETVTDLKPLTEYEYIVLIGGVECGSVKSFKLNPVSGLKLQMDNNNQDGEKGESIRPVIKITNGGTQAVNLSEIKIRYYYTIDGDVGQEFTCDYTAMNSPSSGFNNEKSYVHGSFNKMDKSTSNADYYLEITFDSKTLEKDASLEVGPRINKKTWADYDQTNDYSYKGQTGTPQDWEKTVIYWKNDLVFGKNPE